MCLDSCSEMSTEFHANLPKMSRKHPGNCPEMSRKLLGVFRACLGISTVDQLDPEVDFEGLA